MTNYKVTNYNDKTPEAQQTKLETNLKAIEGIDTVKMLPNKSEISLSFSAPQPSNELIHRAVSKAGFTLGAQI